MQSWPQWSLVTALWHAASEYHKQREPRQVSNHRPLPSLPTCSSDLLAKITNQTSTPMRWQSTSKMLDFSNPLRRWSGAANSMGRHVNLRAQFRQRMCIIIVGCGNAWQVTLVKYCFCGAQYVARAVQLDSDETGTALKSASFLATSPSNSRSLRLGPSHAELAVSQTLKDFHAHIPLPILIFVASRNISRC